MATGRVRAGFFYTQTRSPNPARLLNGFFFRAPLNLAKFGPIRGPNSGLTKKKFKYSSTFLECSGNQTLQSRTIQTQKHYNPKQYKLRILLPILVIFFFQNSFSFSTSKSELHGQTFMLRNSPFTTVPHFSFSSQLVTCHSPPFKIGTPWPDFSFSSLHG